jgi:hypothetical protein
LIVVDFAEPSRARVADTRLPREIACAPPPACRLKDQEREKLTLARDLFCIAEKTPTIRRIIFAQ